MEDSHPDGRSLAGGAGQRPRFIPHIADRPSGHVLLIIWPRRTFCCYTWPLVRPSVRPSGLVEKPLGWPLL